MKQWEKILEAIRSTGSTGILTSALIGEIAPNAKEGFKGCANYTGRISDCRHHGWDIRGFSVPGSPQSRYFLFGKAGEPPRFTDEECQKTTDRLALKKVRKPYYFGAVRLTDGTSFEVGEWVTQ